MSDLSDNELEATRLNVRNILRKRNISRRERKNKRDKVDKDDDCDEVEIKVIHKEENK